MKIYRYSNQRSDAIYEIARVAKGGNTLYRGCYTPPRGAKIHNGGPDYNYCIADIEDSKIRNGKPVTELQIGTIEVNPQGAGLGSLMLYHVLSRSSTMAAVTELHICDGEPGRAFWLHQFTMAIRIPNLPGDANVANDYRAQAGPMLAKLRADTMAKGWKTTMPEVTSALTSHPLLLARG